MKKLLSGFVIAITALAHADTYYWAPAGNVFGDYSLLDNWKLDAELTTPAASLPASGDRLYLQTSATAGATVNDASFDLNGGSYVLGGFTGSPTAGAGNFLNVNVKNGTLTINDATKLSRYHSISHRLTEGATLNVYVSTTSAHVTAALGGPTYYATYDVSGNSTVNIYNKCYFLQFKGLVEAGSSLNFQHGEICFDSNTQPNNYNDGRYQTYVYNNGTVRFPNGCNWVRSESGGDWSNKKDYTKAFNFYQRGGEVRLGGDFKKTSSDSDAWKRGMYFFFEGGKIVAEENAQVAFLHHTGTSSGAEEVFASVKAGVDVTAEPLAGATLDMSIFTYGDGSSLAKTGAGTLKLAALPPALDVQAGSVELTQSVVDLTGVTFANGVKVVFGAADNDFSGALPANAGLLDYAVTTAFKGNELVVTVGDATVAGHIRDCINNNMPPALSAAGVVAALEGTSVVLKSALTIAARSFTIVKGAAAADFSAGLAVTGLKGDDAAADIVKNVVYTYGGYNPATSAAGTYAIGATATVSGRYYLQGSVAGGTLYVVEESDATVFYWNAANRAVFADYSDVANWKMTVGGSVVVATRLPSSIDRLYPYAPEVSGTRTVASFDYHGGTYSIAGYGADEEKPDWTDWRSYWFNLTNGTFKILNTRKLYRNSPICFNVAKRAHLDYYAQGVDLSGKVDQNVLDAMGAPSVEGRIDVADGGSATVHNPCSFLNFIANIAPGGTMTFADGRYNLDNNNVTHREYRQLNNSGTLSFPNGWDWVIGAVWSNGDGAKTLNINQNAGELRLGGDVKKTGNSSHVYTDELFFNFNGGKLVAEAGRSVAFIQNIGTKSGVEEIFPSVAANADVEVETLAGATLDMSIFTYGANSKMTKTGAGTLKLADLPPTLAIEGGSCVFTEALTAAANITNKAEGVTCVFGTTNNVLAALGSTDYATYTVERAFSKQGGEVILQSEDSDLLESVKNHFVLPVSIQDKYEVAIRDGKLYLDRIHKGFLVIIH